MRLSQHVFKGLNDDAELDGILLTRNVSSVGKRVELSDENKHKLLWV